MRIGVAWSGNPQHRDDRRRSIPFEMFSTLLVDRPDVEFHVVQTELRAADRTELQRLPHVHNHADALADFGDTAALLTLMDLVISVDTSAVHLAGALGCPVWLLLAHVADWRWLLERDDSPWYPTLELFRQPTRDDWTSVLSAVGERIDALLA
jgi:ADP-heptose:LPS heptosyltransferase